VAGTTKDNGAIFLDSILGLMILLPSLLLVFEINKREILDVSIQHVACLGARQKALGIKEEIINQAIQKSLAARLGKHLGEKVNQELKRKYQLFREQEDLRWLELGDKAGMVAEFSLRYPQLYFFETHRGRKHHQELIRRCLFPLS